MKKQWWPLITIYALVAVLLIGSCALVARHEPVKRPILRKVLRVAEVVWWLL